MDQKQLMKTKPLQSINLVLFGCYCILNIFQFFILPLYLLQTNPWWGLLLIPGILLTNTFWALLHEGIHNMLVNDRIWNIRLSRLMGILHGSSFYLLRFGHLMHHQFNRTEIDRTEVYDLDKDNYLIASIRYYFTICGGLYIAEVIGAWLTCLPRNQLTILADKLFKDNNRMKEACQRLLLKPSILRSMRADTLGIFILFSIGFYLYSAYWWLLLSALLGRGFLISWADNLPHYGTPLNDTGFAYNLSAPRWRQIMLLNFNLHRVHHHYPTVPWHQLPAYFEKDQSHYDHHYFSTGLSQFRGPISCQQLPHHTTDFSYSN